jgi:hypothetical protein
MAEIPVPEISKNWKDKDFGASDIKWVKTVNDKYTHSAYLPPDRPYGEGRHGRVVINSDGVFFCLQLNDRFEDSLNNVNFGDIILLYQDLKDKNDKKTAKFFTHLVTPWGDSVVPSPYGENSGWPGRWVKVIAMTKNTVVSSIHFENTVWPTIGFTSGFYPKLSFRDGSIYEINPSHELSNEKLSELQNNIWDRFGYFFENGPEFFCG